MHNRLLSSAIVVGLVAAGTTGYLMRHTEPPPKTAEARLGTIDYAVSASGKISAAEQVDVGPRIGGLVAELLAKEGDLVQAGQLLARLDDQELQARVRQADSTVGQTQAAIGVAEAQLQQATAQRDRVARLVHSGVAPQSELDDARQTVDVRVAQVKTAQASLREAQAALDYVRTQMTTTTVKAPIAGRVITKHYDRGKVVQAGEPLYTIADSARFLVKAEVDESDAGRVQVGQSAVMTSDAFPGRKISSTVDKIAFRVGRKRIRSDNPAAIQDTKVLEVEIPINPEPELRIGMEMDVRIQTGHKERVVLIPRQAVVRKGPDLLVTVMAADQLEERHVQLGSFDGQLVEVLSGVKPGESVVVGKGE